MPEWYRAVRYKAFVGIPRSDPGPAEGTYGLPGLDTVLSDAGALSRLAPLLDRHTINEPLHVSLRDRGFTDPTTTPKILVIDITALQTDGGLNEIPRATCTVPLGRAIFDPTGTRPSVLGGDEDFTAASIIHLLAAYLTRHVPVRIYLDVETTSAEGNGDNGDNQVWPTETMVLFDGFLTGPSHQAAETSGTAVIHLVHFLGLLTFSSSLSGQVAAGGTIPAAFAAGLWPGMTSGAVTTLTPYGAVAASLAGGTAATTDFWGYQIPSGTRVGIEGRTDVLPQNSGVKGFLTQLASTDLFNWQVISGADFGGTFCQNRAPDQLKNNLALGALNRIEPLWPDWAGLVAGGIGGAAAVGAERATASAIWSTLETAIVDAAGSGVAVDRTDLLTRTGNVYFAAGYRYGMPVSFYLSGGNALDPFAAGRGFAQDITMATLDSLTPMSFWDLLSGQYAGRYQIAVVPMADRALIIPSAPVLGRVWQTVYASEIFSWSDDVQLPVPVRGVMLSSNRMAGTGALAGGFRPFEAGYDSCQPGVFITREMPSWLITAYSSPSLNAVNTVQFGIKSVVGAPWTTGPLSQLADGVADAARVGKANAADKTTANMLAKSMWQQERLRFRTVYIGGRFRVDIAPGSTIAAELPHDKYVAESDPGELARSVQGLVLRVTHSIDVENQSASTSIQLGFVRLDGETVAGQPLYGNVHPYWRTACYGAPWCDSQWIRDLLGESMSLDGLV